MSNSNYAVIDQEYFTSATKNATNKNVGIWFRILCELSKTPSWEATKTIDEWAKVIKEHRASARVFLHADVRSIDNMKVTRLTTAAPGGVAMYRIKETFWSSDNSTGLKISAKRKVNLPLITNRNRLKQMIKEAYHPERRHLQPDVYERHFKASMIEASSKAIKHKDKIELENKEAKRILDYFEYLRRSSFWDAMGKLLLGLGFLFKRRAWRTDGSYLRYLNDKERGNVAQDGDNMSIKERIMKTVGV